MSEEDKSKVLLRIRILNNFIRNIEDFAKDNRINFHEEKVYIAARAQRKVLRELLDLKRS